MHLRGIKKKIDLAYLPDVLGPDFSMGLLDAVNLDELNKAYEFSVTHHYRAFCTYLDLIGSIKHLDKTIKVVPVVDFPKGAGSSCRKVFDIGRAHACCMNFLSSEVDLCLNININEALEDIKKIDASGVEEYIGIKYIVELGHRTEKDIQRLVELLNTKRHCKMIKTNTSKLGTLDFEYKKELLQNLDKISKKPIKYSGGIQTPAQIEILEKLNLLNPLFYGVSFNTAKEWGA